jgi:hypothetical protein
MRMKIGTLAAVVGVMLALGASASRAAIVQSIINTDSDTLVGSITFPTFTGSTDAGVLFSYSGFTQADITSISWTLDPTTDAVVALDLKALQGDNPCPSSQPSCSNSTVSFSPTLEKSGGVSCSLSGGVDRCREGIGQADIAFVPLAVPELSTWAMMLVGFVGLGLAGRRSMSQAAGQTDGGHFVIPAQAGI